MQPENRNRITVNTAGKWQLYAGCLLPANVEPLGTVTCADGHTGALVQHTQTGIYSRVNAGVYRALDSRKVAAALAATKAAAQRLFDGAITP